MNDLSGWIKSMICIFNSKKLALFLLGLFVSCVAFAAKNTVPTDLELGQDLQKIREQIYDAKYDIFCNKEFGAIISSPYVGLRAAYDTADLITDLPTVNADIVLLEQKRDIAKYKTAHNLKTPDRPVMALSGALEADAYFWRDFTQGSSSDIDLGRAELDILGDINPWVMGALFLVYDHVRNPTIANSRVYVDSGFVTLGNLQQSPFYFTIGQIYVPFGQYTHYMVSIPLTRVLMRTRERAAVLGYAKDGIYGTLYGYKGDSYTDNRDSSINAWGASLGYEWKWRDIDFGAYTYYINNVADSEGMQSTDGNFFPGFKTHEKLQHFVPGIGLRGKIKYKPYSFNVEYVGAVRRFDKTLDLSFNDRGAKPGALDIEANYDFTFHGFSSSFAVGYGRVWEGLALNIPRQSAFMKVATSWFKSTIESLELREDWNYNRSDNATGAGTNVPVVGAQTRYIINAEIGVYF